MKFFTALTRYPSSDFHKTKLVKCSCMKSLAKHEIRIKIKLPEDLDAYDRKKTRAWNDFDILFNVKYNFINSSELQMCYDTLRLIYYFFHMENQ